MMKRYKFTLLAAAVSILPAVQAQELEVTPSVKDLTQTTKLEEKKQDAVIANKISANKELQEIMDKIVKARTVRYLVYKDAEIVDELVKVYARIDKESKDVNGMVQNCLKRAFSHAIRIKDRAAYEKVLALFNALPEDQVKTGIRSFVGDHLGPYAGETHLFYVSEFYEANKDKMDQAQRMRSMPGFVKQNLRFAGDMEKARYYIDEIVKVKNPYTDPKQERNRENFEKTRTDCLNKAVCNVLEYKTELGEEILKRYQKQFTPDQMGNIYVAFMRAAQAEKDRVLFDRMLENVKRLPKSNSRYDQIRTAANIAYRSPVVKQKILDDLLKENLDLEQRFKTIKAKISFPGYFNYGFHEPGSYENAKKLTQEALDLLKKCEKVNIWEKTALYKDAIKGAFEFGDIVWFRQLMNEIISEAKANGEKRAADHIAHAAKQLQNQKDNIARRKAGEQKQIADLKKNAKDRTARAKTKAEKDKISAELKKAVAQRQDQFKRNAANDARNIENAEKYLAKAKQDAIEMRASYTNLWSNPHTWQLLAIDAMMQGQDGKAVQILEDARKVRNLAKNNDIAVLKYFLSGGSFAGFDKAFADNKFTSEQKMNLIRNAGNIYFQAKRFETARKLNDEIMKNMFREAETNKRYTVKYLADAPKTADAWSRTPDYQNWNIMETRFAPYFGYDVHNDKLLLKDTELPKLDDAYKTGLHIVFDENAVHIYARIDDPEAEKVAQGMQGGASLEWTFQPGADHAYHTFFFNSLPDSSDPHWVNWAGPTKRYRLTYDGITKDAVITKKGFAAHVAIPWLYVYDRLPGKEQGNNWKLGLCVWNKGSRTLGGMVHELGRALKLDFEMTPEQRTALERTICIQAFAKYNKIRNDAGGIIQNWNDYLLGDPEFYEKCLKDYIAELDEAGKKLMAPAADADIHAIFTKYVPQWAEINYMLDEKRAEYLKSKLFSK